MKWMKNPVHNSSRSKPQLDNPALGSSWHFTEGGGTHLSIPLSLIGPTQPRTTPPSRTGDQHKGERGSAWGVWLSRPVKFKSTEPGHGGSDSEAAGLLSHCHLHIAQKRPPEQRCCVQARIAWFHGVPVLSWWYTLLRMAITHLFCGP